MNVVVLEYVSPAKTGAKVVKVRVMPAGAVSRNNRFYTEESKQRWVGTLKARLANGIERYNYFDHPDMVTTESGKKFSDTERPKVSKMLDIAYENGEIWSISTLVDSDGNYFSPEGKYCSELAVMEGVNLDVSLRGIADCDGENATGACDLGTTDVNEGWDWLPPGVVPGFAGAGLTEVLESKCACKQRQKETHMDFKTLTESLFKSGVPWGTVAQTLAGQSATAAQVAECQAHYTFLAEAAGCAGDAGHSKKDEMMNNEDKKAMAAKESYTQPAPVVIQVPSIVSPEVQRLIDKQKAEDQAKEVEGHVYECLGRTQFGRHNLTNHTDYPPAKVTEIADTVAKFGCKTKDEASGMIHAKLEQLVTESRKLAADSQQAAQGNVVIEMGNAPMPFMELAEKIEQASLDYMKSSNRADMRSRYKIYESCKGANKNYADSGISRWLHGYKDAAGQQVEGSYAAVMESYKHAGLNRRPDGRVVTEAVQLGVSDFLLRDLVMLPITKQRFYQTMGASLVNVPGPGQIQLGSMLPSGTGRFISIQTETFVEPTEYHPQLYLNATDTFPQVSAQTTWQQHCAYYSGVSFGLKTPDAIWLAKLPLNIDMLGRITAQASAFMSRIDDLRIHNEILTACDAYKPQPITNETAQAAHVAYNAAGSVVLGGVTYGPTCYGAAWLRRGAGTGATIEFGPVCLPTSKDTIDVNGAITTTVIHPLTHSGNAINGVTQVEGWFDERTRDIRNYPGTTATYAIDRNRGVVVYRATATSGMDASNRPVFTAYHAVTNFTEFDMTLGSSTRQVVFDEWVRGLADLSVEIKAKRNDYPDYALFPELVGGKTIPHAEAFEPLTRLDWAMRNTGFGPEMVIGAITGGVSLLKTETPLPGGNLRGILSRRGHAIFMQIEPMRLEGPFPGHVHESSGAGQARYNSTTEFRFNEMTLLCTPLVKDQAGNVYNFPATGLFFSGAIPGYTLGAD